MTRALRITAKPSRPNMPAKTAPSSNQAGRTVKKEEFLTPEERRAKEADDAKKRAENDASQELRRRDKALLNTYSSEKEIDLKRGRDLQQLDARVNSISSQLKAATANLTSLKQEADGRTASGRRFRLPCTRIYRSRKHA